MPAVSRLSAALLAASLLCPIAIAQTPATPPAQAAPPQAAQPVAYKQTQPEHGYKAPRTSFGQPSFEGVWITNFVLPLESTPQTPMLTVPENIAKQIAAGYAKGVGDALDKQLDPEVPELMRNVE